MNVIEDTTTCDIDKIVGDIPCDRCKKDPATRAVRLASVHGCPFDVGRWLLCEGCANESGVCRGCGKFDSYEAIS